MILNEPTKGFIESYKFFFHKQEEDVRRIKVDYVASRLASFYEKIRQVIDYQEEHLLRKNAIERMLKRRLFFSKEALEISEGLIYELIRGNYFQNESLSEDEIGRVGFILEKYIFILENIPEKMQQDEKEEIRPWIIKLAACEIEERLAPPAFQEMLFNYMFEIMQERIVVVEKILSFATKKITPEFKNAQLFIAIQKALLKADESLLNFRLLKFFYPQWLDLNQSTLPEITQNILTIKRKIYEQIKQPLNKEFYHYVVGYCSPFLILGDVVQEKIAKIDEVFQYPESLEGSLRHAYEKRYKACKTRLARSGFRSVLSIFLSKVLLAFLIEVPFDTYVVHHFSSLTLAFNLTFPVLLMFLIVKSIKAPRRENQEFILLEAMRITYKSKEQEKKEIKLPKKRSWFLNHFFGFIYVITFFITFGAIVFGLLEVGFSPLSIIIFIIFLCLISFSGLRIKEWSKELRVGEDKEGISSLLMDFFGLPIIKAGKWLSKEFSKINLLILFSNLILELPVQTFVEFISDWRQFAKEKKGEIQ